MAYFSDDIGDLAASSSEKYNTLCEKVRDIPNILSCEGEGRDTNILEHDTESLANELGASDDVDFSDDCDVAMETDMLPGQVASEDEEMDDIMGKQIFILNSYLGK